jgi:aminoglycoside phosphotransferase (APT) family kinase protein
MGGSLREPGDGSWPRHLDEVRPEWLTTCLRRAGATRTVSVVGHNSDPAIAEGFASAVVRIHLRYDGHEPAAPKSLIAKFPTPHAGMRGVAHAAGAYEREVRFYRELAGSAGLRVPGCHAAEFDGSSGDFVLLLEDVVAAPMNGHDVSLERARAVVQGLARFHATFWNSPILAALQPPDERAEQLRAMFLESLVSERAALESYGPNITRTALAIGAFLRDGPRAPISTPGARTLVHGDLRPENLISTGPGCDDFVVIDWQTLRVAESGATDLARFIVSALSVEQRRSAEAHLLSAYHRTLVELGIEDLGLDELHAQYRRALDEQVIGYTILTAAFRGDPHMRTLIAPIWRLEAALSDALLSERPFEQSARAGRHDEP